MTLPVPFRVGCWHVWLQLEVPGLGHKTGSLHGGSHCSLVVFCSVRIMKTQEEDGLLDQNNLKQFKNSAKSWQKYPQKAVNKTKRHTSHLH